MKRVLLCSMAVPWPEKPLLGNFHVYQAQGFAELGAEMRLFGPSPLVPGWVAKVSRRARGHHERPDRYAIDGVEVCAPRVTFAFPPFVRFGMAAWAPRLVAGRDPWVLIHWGYANFRRGSPSEAIQYYKRFQ